MTPEPHTIRLRRPWRCRPTAAGVVWTRRFQRPTGLDAQSAVWLCLAGFANTAQVALNGQTLRSVQPQATVARFEVTAALAASNELELALAGVADPSELTGEAPPGEVYLEIRLHSAAEEIG